ncbi:MAG: hypothetical protein FWD77_00595 [Betaproteobacteria bacterium]|nr:hypothetical protein [Betaproteobacteria bacterium]
MKRKTNRIAGIVCLAVELIFSANACATVQYECTDEDGKKIHQAGPCPGSPAISAPPCKSDFPVPVKSHGVSLENALLTIREFNRALNQSQSPGIAMRFIADPFKGQIYWPTGKVEMYDSAKYSGMLDSTLHATRKYHVERFCTQASPVQGDKAFALVCRTIEIQEIPGKLPGLTKSKETIRLISRDFEILIDSIMTHVESIEELDIGAAPKNTTPASP